MDRLQYPCGEGWSGRLARVYVDYSSITTYLLLTFLPHIHVYIIIRNKLDHNQMEKMKNRCYGCPKIERQDW